MFKKIIKLILILLCMFTIFSFSADNGEKSTKKSDSVIVKISETFLGRKLSSMEKEKYIDKFVILVRKSSHFLIYALLGILVISFIKEFGILNYKSIMITLLVVFLYACSDEIHQLFVSGRSGEILDVLIDTIGGFVGSYIYYLIYKYRLRRKLYGQKETTG